MLWVLKKIPLNERILLSTHIIGFGWIIREIVWVKELYTRLNETILLSTHIIGFGWIIREIFWEKELYNPPYLDLYAVFNSISFISEQ